MSEWYPDKFRNPVQGVVDTMKKGASGVYRERDEYVQFMYKALVIGMDTQGGLLETPTGQPEGGRPLHQVVKFPNGQKIEYDVWNEMDKQINKGPRNPKNSIKARIISNAMDEMVDDDDLRVYWPMFPGVANPGAGEVVFVVFEDESFTHGLWLSRAPLNGQFDTPNNVMMSSEMQGVKPLSNLFSNQSVKTGSGGGVVAPLSKDRFRLTRKFLDVPKIPGTPSGFKEKKGK